jgi:hypothetical protein
MLASRLSVGCVKLNMHRSFTATMLTRYSILIYKKRC